MEEKTLNAVHIDETVFDGQVEQGVELDYVLPDYCPDIFKLLSCTLTPKTASYNVSGDGRLDIDGVVYIKVLYLAENSTDVYCIDQRYTYSKTVDMSRKGAVSETPLVSLSMKSDYCSCRAASPRRIDVRGAVSCRIKAVSCTEYALPEIPRGLQVRMREVQCCGKTLFAEKQMSVREEIETGAPGIAFIMQCDAVPKITDLRVIADKAVLKGTVTINALYGVANPESNGCSETEKMSADIPISAILDIDGITDVHRTFPEICVMNMELIPKSDSGIISCELLVMCRVRAQQEETAEIPIDVYSTEYETESTSNLLKIAAEPRTVSQNVAVRTNLTTDKGEIRSVWDVSSELKNPVCRPNADGELVLSGQLFCRAFGKNADGVPFLAEKQEAVEQIIPAANVTGDTVIDFTANITDTGFSIKSDGSLELTASIGFEASLHNIKPIEAINSVVIAEDRPKDKSDEFALRICYTNDSSDCWSIAKQCNTTVKAIMEENEIEDCDAPLSGMIIIPTV
ncbi:MAG: DUF3794 domain-containing protein [Oscillospiraceae bacterium]|nr:DUF3794 domain-containing protein [Oscillospiraceae bacterium]